MFTLSRLICPIARLHHNQRKTKKAKARIAPERRNGFIFAGSFSLRYLASFLVSISVDVHGTGKNREHVKVRECFWEMVILWRTESGPVFARNEK
jgi:hypothetical protein